MDKFETLLVKKGLYDSIDITVDDLPDIEKYLSGNSSHNVVDCFCPICQTVRPFEFDNCQIYRETGMVKIALSGSPTRGRTPKPTETFQGYLNKRYVLTYRCTRDKEQTLLFDLVTDNTHVIKIGQYPPTALLDRPELNRYKSLLGKQRYAELNRAVWLATDGIGIGSFVYFRRIIEGLVFETYDKNKATLKISKEDFERLRFNEKIDALKEYLPDTLVENKAIYNIVSKGIHELSEEDCLKMFNPLLIGIELILDDILAQKEREAKKKELQQFVSKTSEKLK